MQKCSLFGKLPVNIQQKMAMANTDDNSPEEIKTYQYCTAKTNTSRLCNKIPKPTSISTRFQIQKHKATSHDLSKAHTNQKANDVIKSATAVENKATGNKNAEYVNATKP